MGGEKAFQAAGTQSATGAKHIARAQTSKKEMRPIWRSKAKWPRANHKEAWKVWPEHAHSLCKVSAWQCTRLNVFGIIVNEESKKRFWEMAQRKIITREMMRWGRYRIGKSTWLVNLLWLMPCLLCNWFASAWERHIHGLLNLSHPFQIGLQNHSV